MDYSNERYVRIYTRDTETWRLLTWEAQALLALLLRKVDRSGVLETELGVEGAAAAVGMPLEVVERALPQLLRRGTVTPHRLGYCFPRFLEAQEAPASDAQRAKEARERRRLGLVTNRDASVTNRDGSVTQRDESSRGVGVSEQNVTPTNQPSDPASLPIQPGIQVPQVGLPGFSGKPDVAKKPKAKKASPDADPRVKAVQELWATRYKAHVGVEYPGNYARAGKAIRELAAGVTVEILAEHVEAFWRSPDGYILGERGGTVEAWVRDFLPKQIARAAATTPAPAARASRWNDAPLDLEAERRRLRETGR